jgi:hypothetical protein
MQVQDAEMKNAMLLFAFHKSTWNSDPGISPLAFLFSRPAATLHFHEHDGSQQFALLALAGSVQGCE